jgi:hypothetical protein
MTWRHCNAPESQSRFVNVPDDAAMAAVLNAPLAQWQALERVRGAHTPEAMPTVNFSVPQDVKQTFDAAFAGQNKGAITVELIDNALALLHRPRPRSMLAASALSGRAGGRAGLAETRHRPG